MLVPPEANGVRCISMGFFAEEDQPVIWRGPMLHKALEQFLTDVYWDDPDFLLVDLPPGTGDIALSLAQFLPRAEVYVVTTPQPAAQKVAQRAAFMAEKVQPRGAGRHREHVAGSPATTASATRSSAPAAARSWPTASTSPSWARSPWCRSCGRAATRAVPIAAEAPDSEAAAVFRAMAERIDTELAPTKRYHPELKITRSHI